MFRLVTDVSSEDDKTPAKLRFAWYSTLEEAIVQAEHEMGTESAQDRLRDHYRNHELVLHPSGVRVVRVEDEDGATVWEP